MKKAVKQNIHGVILLDKPSGISSNRALQRVKHLVNAKKAGHTGSLDPLATGLLPICLGQATKVSEYMLNSHKKYKTVIRLGQTTDTLDSEGEILREREVAVSAAQIAAALDLFRGEIEQIPPMYSALKKNGQPLYKLAREGKEVARAARKMTVFELHAQRLDEFHLVLDVHCSSGFYIRSLAADLGESLGCGAHVVELRRTAIKSIEVDAAITLADLEAATAPLAELRPIDYLLSDMPRLVLDKQQADDLLHGRKAPANGLASDLLSRFYAADGNLLGVGEITAGGLLKSHKLFVT